MSFGINNIPYFGNINGVQAINNPRNTTPVYKNNLTADTFESTNPVKYTTEFMINKLAKENPQIEKILRGNNIPYNLNMQGLNEILAGHCTDTQKIAEGIVNNLPFALESKADLESIQSAAYLHDIGKVFIPDEILNKKGKLDETEKEIMHKHPELGYELLKNSDLNPKILYLIKNHHQNAKKSGYPNVGKNFSADLDLQILSLADKYSALTEERPYKKSLNREQALTIIRPDVRSGKINPLVYNALVNYTDEVALKNYSKAS